MTGRVIHSSDALESIVLEDDESGARATLAPARGGMLTRFDVGGTPILFLDESTLRDPTQNVRGGVPILFPIAGKLPGDRYAIGSREYSMKQHGFARTLPWTIVQEASGSEDATVTLGLETTDATEAQYPFDFSLRYTYVLRGPELFIEQRFENRGETPMPIAPGLHPYFYVPDATKGGARVDTNATRAYDHVTGRNIPVPHPIDLTQPEVNLYLLDHGPRQTVLTRPGLPSVRVQFGDDQAVLVVWTLKGRDFVCVEPWRAGLGALADATAPAVPPGETASTILVLSLA